MPALALGLTLVIGLSSPSILAAQPGDLSVRATDAPARVMDGPGRTGHRTVQVADTAAVSRVLDRFHDAASDADGDRYFALFAEDAVFIGTDPGERWTLSEFREYALPYFEAGRGWTYVPTERHVSLSADGETAWFDEMLRNEGLGETRGTGVLVREDGAWKVAQYHLTIPIPNDLAGRVVEMIRGN